MSRPASCGAALDRGRRGAPNRWTRRLSGGHEPRNRVRRLDRRHPDSSGLVGRVL